MKSITISVESNILFSKLFCTFANFVSDDNADDIENPSIEIDKNVRLTLLASPYGKKLP